MKNKLYLLSALAGAIMAAAFVSSEAAADYGSTGYSCHATGGSMVDSNYGVGNASTTQDMVLRCDPPGRVVHYKHRILRVALHGRDGTTAGRLSSQLCVSYADVAGGACGPNTSSAIGDVKNEELILDHGVWDNTSLQFPYVAVRVPPRQGSSTSSIFGIRYQ